MILRLLLAYFLLSCFQNAVGGSQKSDLITKLHGFFLFKGTNFCGPGAIAKTYNDLGRNRETDKCCRAHDMQCKARIKSFRKKYGLRNISWKVSSHCDCEKKFMNCLLKVNNNVSKELFNIYFKKLSPRCIRFKTVTMRKCTTRKWFICREYKFIKKRRAYFVDLHKALGL